MATSPLLRALTGYPAVQEPRDTTRATQTTVINIRERLRQIEEQVNLLIASWRIAADPFPDAPSDGYIYGRRNQAWTRVGGQPAPPQLSVQWNNGGNFGGSPEFVFDHPNRTLILGAYPRTDVPAWTIKPQLVTAANDGISLTIKAGDSDSSSGSASRGGDLTLWSGASETGGPGGIYLRGAHTDVAGVSGGPIEIYAGNSTVVGGTFGQDGGSIYMTAGASAQEDGGGVIITGGHGTNVLSGSGGHVQITAGRGGNTGGTVTIKGGQSDGNPGGGVQLVGGYSSSGVDDASRGKITVAGTLLLQKSETFRPAMQYDTFLSVSPSSPNVGSMWGLADGLYYRTASGTIEIKAGLADGDRGDVTVSSLGTVFTIDNNTVTYAKMQDVSAASRLLGRGAAAGSGDVQEIILGLGLSMSGTTLNVGVGAELLVDNTSGGSILFDDSGDVLYEG